MTNTPEAHYTQEDIDALCRVQWQKRRAKDRLLAALAMFFAVVSVVSHLIGWCLRMAG